MRARMFKPQFAPLVKAGTKRQTIRPFPKRMPKVGDHESWREWTGKPYRSKQRELAQVRIIGVERISIHQGAVMSREKNPRKLFFEIDDFARADGFKNWEDMVRWFENQHGLPFKGILIRAEDLK